MKAEVEVGESPRHSHRDKRDFNKESVFELLEPSCALNPCNPHDSLLCGCYSP